MQICHEQCTNGSETFKTLIPQEGILQLKTMLDNNSPAAIHIDVPLVKQLIASQFRQWADLPIRAVEFSGWDNRTFHLGDQMIVRLPSSEAYSLQVEKEQRWLPKLAPLLPLPVPTPVAMGKPESPYPWHWSVYKWLDGQTASIERIGDLSSFAISLAQFLAALQKIDTLGGPEAGPHSFYRGGPLATYDEETQQAIVSLGSKIDTKTVTEIWQAALATRWNRPPVWIHGDIAIGNLLVNNGQLSAVIDFGTSAIGDPACDLSIAWTLFQGESREAFRSAISLDAGTWARGRGWTLWKALIVLAGLAGTNPLEVEKSQRVLNEVLTDYKKHRGRT